MSDEKTIFDEQLASEKPPADARTDVPTERLPAQVPRRFPMGTLLGLVALFAILLSVLRTLGVPPTAMALLFAWVFVIAASQALLFKGRHPRLASVCAGMMFYAVWPLTGLIQHCLSPRPYGHFLEDFMTSLLRGLPFSALFGYVTGAALAAVFLFAHRLRTGQWYERRPIEAPKGECPFAPSHPPESPAASASEAPVPQTPCDRRESDV